LYFRYIKYFEDPEIQIRKAVITDEVSIHALINELEEKVLNETYFKQLYYNNLIKNDFIYYVAEYQNLIVGFMSVNIQYPLHHCGKIAEVQELIVNKDYRNLKIGSALIQTAKKVARENACDTLELTSRFKRTDAHRFYEREGFHKTHFKFLMAFNS
jgi:PhnO protein